MECRYEEEEAEQDAEEQLCPDVELLLQTMERRGGSGHEFSNAVQKYLKEDAEADVENCRNGKLPHEMRINQYVSEKALLKV